ncbi:magnesium/cobalt transporter CorA [Galbibacter sp. EGI 63066]|uniref:magnesium/cobalt transporter CorA n=1 Tax=Galbibacter sp. EGI 63066 TaxID=2993559 RepID=UPI0022493C3B|nr:magnesium/cobalt transporter CorA [Galbibacter sp. EGI 63066]MCX2682028.1 magnesium/cobalt transporter CorA [Galbibacter sp. EGI 63066]
MAKKSIDLKRVLKKSFKSQRSIGQAPGTVTYVGARQDGRYAIDVLDYSNDMFHLQSLTDVNEALTFKDNITVSWFNIVGLSNEVEITKLGDHFNLNSLVLEDIVNTSQRPKVDEYDDYAFVTLKMIYLDDDYKSTIEHCGVVLCEHNVLLFQEIDADVFEGLRNRIKNKSGRIRSRGADYLFFTIIDAIVDQYFVVSENIASQIDDLEEEVYNNPKEETAQKIQQLKKEVLQVRKWVSPVKDLISRIIETDHRLISNETKVFFKDALDHSLQIYENIQLYREMTTNLMEIYMTNMSNKMNEVMKVLTIMASIFIPLTFIAGVYGMNFEYMPELQHRNAYFIVLGLMFIIFILMIIYFKRKKWL